MGVTYKPDIPTSNQEVCEHRTRTRDFFKKPTAWVGFIYLYFELFKRLTPV